MQAFLRLCISEGLDDDEIVIQSRGHRPTLDAFEYDPEAAVVRQLAKLRAEVGASAIPMYMDWAKVDQAPSNATWCVEGWIEQGDSASLVGPAKIGKSLLTLEAAACKASGRSILGRDVAPGRVLYLDWENRGDAVLGRLRAMGFSQMNLENLRYVCFPAVPPLDTQAASGSEESSFPKCCC